MAEAARPAALTRRQATAALLASGVGMAVPGLAAVARAPVDAVALREAAAFAMSF